MNFAERYIKSWLKAAESLELSAMDLAVNVLADARSRDAIVWTVGNGGGNTLASHLSIGLTLNTKRSGGQPFRSICLGSDAAALSAAINDFGAHDGLQTILECNGRKGDVLCVFSVSGESENVNRTIRAAIELGVEVIAFVGNPDSTTAQLANYPVLLGSVEPGIAEDVASAVIHAMYCSFMYENSDVLPTPFADV